MKLNKPFYRQAFATALIVCTSLGLHAQADSAMLLSKAVSTGLQQYQSIKAKRNYLEASTALVQNARNEYLPNVVASLQQAYGTINGQFGPAAPVGALGLSSSGPTYGSQSWNAAFGSLYIISTNWEFFTFGRVSAKIGLAGAQVKRDSADLQQEQFVHSVKISGAYLNLLIARRLIQTAQSNLERSKFVQQSVRARTLSGLNPGVDSSIANAEVSRAELAVIDATNNEQQIRNQLIQLLNVAPADFTLDTSYLAKVPEGFQTSMSVTENPQVKFYQTRIDQSNAATSLLKKSIMPGFNLFGIFQSRGSGFDSDYTPAFEDRYTKNYLDGIKPARSNYALGLAVSWNIISPWKVKQQVHAQQFLTAAYQQEYDQVTTQLQTQLVLADQRIQNTLQSVRVVPDQYKAASDAYQQKSVLYKNGLSTIIDLQQALYALNRAEADISVAYINVWQALLLKAATSGDFDLFLKQVK
ncbi:MAG: TolC family protein [Chitinophagaceae bacterium]